MIRLVVALLVFVSAVGLSVAPAQAHVRAGHQAGATAQHHPRAVAQRHRARAAGPGYKVTFAARECDDYSDIMANRARNNIQESLKDLGKDSAYTDGQPVSPAIEEPNDPNCRPLNGWKFTFGNVGSGQKVDNLTTVNPPYKRTAATRSSTPELDTSGNPTGRDIQGATTYTLDSDQVNQAQSQLWVQGGLPDDPLMTGKYGKGEYSFGAMRCAVDNQNGDNEEFLSYPSGSTHIFCYYYAVHSAPASGSITVRKQIEGGGSPATHDFPFHGNISYNPGGTFEVGASDDTPGEMTFVRAATAAGDDPWSFTEDTPDGWTLTGVKCTSEDGTSRTNVSGAETSVQLAADDHVTCTYSNQRRFAEGLSVYKRTVGGIGGPFDFTVRRPDGTTDDLGDTTTTHEGAPVQAGTETDAPTGDYRITETLPAPTGDGYWTNQGALCMPKGGRERSLVSRAKGNTATVDVSVTDQPMQCLFTNRYHPQTKITIEKLTRGGKGPANFIFQPLTPPHPGAKTVRKDPARHIELNTATNGNPDSTTLDHLPAGRYSITELNQNSDNGTWKLTGITCDGRAVDTSYATAIVKTSADQAHHTCRFTDRFTPYPKLRLIKRIIDPHHLRTGRVRVNLTCKDGTHAHLGVPVSRNGTKTLTRAFPGATHCRAREVAAGAAHPVHVATRYRIGNGPWHAGRRTPWVAVGGDHSAKITFTDKYTGPHPKQ